MSSSRVDIGGATVELPHDWLDISEESDDFMSLAKPNGVGALQFSIAEYVGGVDPNIGHDALLELFRGFVNSRGYGEPGDIVCFENPIKGVSGAFSLPGHRLRVWYLSDGQSVALVTYVVQHEHFGVAASELQDASSIAQSLQFY